MYERSAIVLERYFEELFGFNKPNNLKDNYENYKTIIEEVREYQKTVKEEEKEMIKFDEAASKIQEIQKRDENKKKLCEENGVKLLYYSNFSINFPYEVITDKNKLLKIIKDYV